MSKGMLSVVKLMRGMATMRPTLIGKPVTMMRASTNLLCKATTVKRVPLHRPIEVSKLRNSITGAWVFSVIIGGVACHRLVGHLGIPL